MIDKASLVKTLKDQHRNLQSALVNTEKELSSGSTENVIKLLANFRTDLIIHLELENGTFYPDYLRITEEKGGDTEKIKGFIAQMAEIGEKVIAFLSKYITTDSINSNKQDFAKELEKITSTLNLRIQMEEEGIYDIYLVI